MKDTKTAELRKKSVGELEELLQQERVALYVGRRDLVFRRITDTTGMGVRRHNIARILTVMSEKQREGAK